MKRKSLIAALLLLAAGFQTMQAQMVTIYRAGQQPLVYSVLEVDSISFDENQTVANGHEYIDLGLPSGTLWATCNVGAVHGARLRQRKASAFGAVTNGATARLKAATNGFILA